MPDVISTVNDLKSLPDQALQMELTRPSGAVPAYLVLAEAQRRQTMRQASQADRSRQPVGSVYDDVIRDMMARQPPPGAAPAGMTPNASAPPAAPPAPQNFKPAIGMAEGGEVDDDDEVDDGDIVEMPLRAPLSAAGPFRASQPKKTAELPRRAAPPSYDDDLVAAAQHYNLDPDYGRAVMYVESRGQPGAVSPKGAIGPMQLMPGTAGDMGVADPRDPHQNIWGGMRYLRQMVDRYHDVSTALAAYNAGPGAVDKSGGEIPAAAAPYVTNVMQRYSQLKGGGNELASYGSARREMADLPDPNILQRQGGNQVAGDLQDPETDMPAPEEPSDFPSGLESALSPTIGPTAMAASAPSDSDYDTLRRALKTAPSSASTDPYDLEALKKKRDDIQAIMGGGQSADDLELRNRINQMWTEAERRKKPGIWDYLANFGAGMAATPSRNWGQSIAGGAVGMAKGVAAQRDAALKQELELMGVDSKLNDQMRLNQQAVGRATLDMAKTQEQAVTQAATHQQTQAQAQAQHVMTSLLHGRNVIDYKPVGVPVPAGYEPIPDQLNPGMQYIATPTMMKVTNELLPFLPGRQLGDQIPYPEFKGAQVMAAKEAQATSMFEKDFLPGYAEELGTTVAKLDPGQRKAGLAAYKAAQSDPKIQNTAEEIAQGIMDGSSPPDMKGLYRYGPFVRAALHQNHYDLSTAQRDWTNLQRFYGTLNGAQQMRLQQATEFVAQTLPTVRQLYQDWQSTGLPTGFRDYNKAALNVAARLPGDSGVKAQKLLTQLNDLTSELGTMYKGGNSSTDETLRLAGENLRGEWNPQTFGAALDQLENNVKIRRNSMRAVQPAGVSPNSRYTVQPGAGQPAAVAPAGGYPNVTSKADYDKLPRGASYIANGDASKVLVKQ